MVVKPKNVPKFLYLKVLVAIAFVCLIGGLGTRFLQGSYADSSCTVDTIMVNSCHPYIGSYAAYYPGVNPDTPSVTQTQSAEGRVGTNFKFQVVHSSYHQGSGGAQLTSEETYFATHGQIVFVNWWPTKDWGQGDTSAIYSDVDAMANSIKSVAPNKIFLTLQHEPNDKVSALDSPNDSTCAANVGLKGSSGTPEQYRNMWANVENRMKADGVNNVVWAILFESFNQNHPTEFPNCLDQALYPGNQYIDWVGYDTYGNDYTNPNSSTSFQDTAGATYHFLQQLSSDASLRTYGMMSKPVVLGEFNRCSAATDTQRVSYFSDAKYALDHNLYPGIKMYLVFDAPGTGVSGPGGCQLGYENNGTLVPGDVVQKAFNNFATDPVFTNGTSIPSPTPSVSFTAPTGGSKVSGSAVSVAASATVASGSITNITLKANGTTIKSCAGTPCSASWDTTSLANGSYTLAATTTASDGNTASDSETVTVSNAQPVVISPPTNVTSPKQTTTSISLSWSPATDSKYAPGQLSYQLFRNGTQFATTSAGVVSHTDSGLAPGTTYSYTLKATDPAGNTSAASPALAESTSKPACTPPAAPAGLTAKATSPTSVSLGWQAVPNPSASCIVSHYLVSRNGVPLFQPTAANYNDTSAVASTTYSYTVLAVETGNIAGSSSTVQVTTPAAPVTDPGPTAPTNVVASAISSSQINLSWTPGVDSISGIKQYNVLRDGNQVGTTTVPSFGDSGLAAGSKHTYQIQAVSGNNKTASSVSVSATTLTDSNTSGGSGGNATGSSDANTKSTVSSVLVGTSSVGSGSDTGASTVDNPTAAQTPSADTLSSDLKSSSQVHSLPLKARVVAFASTGMVMLIVIAYFVFHGFGWRPKLTTSSYLDDPDIRPGTIVSPHAPSATSLPVASPSDDTSHPLPPKEHS